ncbi:hypothetical protein L198_06052 [Cryptococcus wingfieldii CBS 7118]|uniref:WW domain-containing protein n=1 Tax=Cryptococcus wingfieldii CBS 7118 TaxID=1295528 RepID=A0A1E3IS49_9TREE|nr:hypothetical protein L198_06052 [Cryptococcus wingfieldii CBS 7118]ODN90736.1 hypothetical protein L198_06052 [Cryptococcus wingfieldii CBS 7118]
MPNDAPPPYTTAGSAQPATQNGNLAAPAGPTRSPSAISSTSDETTDDDSDLLATEERRDMDDAARDLPDGWIRCFDPKQNHHFYVDEKTKRSIWVHPYDDPEFLRTLPPTHPAHPDSKQAKAVRQRSEDEGLAKSKRKEIKNTKGTGAAGLASGSAQGGSAGDSSNGDGNRNWFQKRKDAVIGTKEERVKAKEEKRRAKAERERLIAQRDAEYRKKRQELVEAYTKQNSTRSAGVGGLGSGYAAPMTPISRSGYYSSSPYGYGYGGCYGRRGYGGLGGGGLGMPLMMGGGMGLLGAGMLSGGMGGFGGGFGGCGGGGCGGGGGELTD